MIQLQDVDLKLLRVFEAVVRCGGLSAAQAELNVGQSTISTQIGQLEVRLGVRLCDRGRGGFRLTEQGKAVHEATQRLFGAIEHFRVEADFVKRKLSGTLKLGVIDNTVTDPGSPMRSAVKRFLARGKDVHIDVYIGSPAELEQRVLDGRLHVAIGHFRIRVPGLESMPLYEELHGLYCSAEHALAASGLSEAAMRCALHDARVVARGYLRRADLDLLGVEHAAATADNVEAQAIMILSAACIGFLPCHYAAPWIESGDLVRLLPKQLALESRFSAITRRLPLSPLISGFLADLKGATQAA